MEIQVDVNIHERQQHSEHLKANSSAPTELTDSARILPQEVPCTCWPVPHSPQQPNDRLKKTENVGKGPAQITAS